MHPNTSAPRAPEVVRTTRYAPNERMATHCDRRPRLSVVLAGRLRETSGRQEIDVGPLGLAVKSADALHTTQFGPDGAVVASIDLAELDGVSLPNEAGGTMPGWHWASVHELQAERRALVSALNEIFRFPHVPAARDELGEQVWLLLDAVQRPSTAGRGGARPAWLTTVRARIDDAPEEAVSVEALALDAGVTSTHLTRRFRAAFGCSVTKYRTRRRIQLALQMLGLREVRLVDVAMDSGFHDQSHFTHHFRAITGTTPGAWRSHLLAT